MCGDGMTDHRFKKCVGYSSEHKFSFKKCLIKTGVNDNELNILCNPCILQKKCPAAAVCSAAHSAYNKFILPDTT